ncbi:piggyBac transposable element-derived protein 4-like [Rhagoletis pomonella]|uniref:piggyBac transposable element-derived protein 4-like n=1 Tax=Rhagoletis pomonella TaxID=28610 RepID=UPI00177D0C3D|nr:piggyBac transposable element-derived protein 4-like [Rhagoletis pomonella]
MSKETFQKITRIIRFDDPTSRRNNCDNFDKFTPIRNLWDKWVELLPMYYNPSECVTIDEQLLGFHGRCSFRQYMPSKPERYGIKFWMLACSKSCYVWNMQPYLGKMPGNQPERIQGQRVVLDLVTGLKGHNVTIDNFFSSFELGQKLLEKNLTMVGTMRKNKRSIPAKLSECKKVPVYTSNFAFTQNTTLVSYIGRKDKCPVVQSTMHHTMSTGDPPKRLPEIIEYYNKTKGGVDTVDKMLSTYSCKRKTNRWPMAVFSNIVDISALNALIVWMSVNKDWVDSQNKGRRKIFLLELGLSLAKPYMEHRKNYTGEIPSRGSGNLVMDNADSQPSGSQPQHPVPPKKGHGVTIVCQKKNIIPKIRQN